MSDYCDGLQFSNNPLYSTDASSLQIVLYYDELEICNPLGSRRKKHKLGISMLLYLYVCLLMCLCVQRCLLLHAWKH